MTPTDRIDTAMDHVEQAMKLLADSDELAWAVPPGRPAEGYRPGDREVFAPEAHRQLNSQPKELIMKFAKIKSATLYSIEFPHEAMADLPGTLEKHEFKGVQPHNASGYGFIRNPMTGEFVTELQGLGAFSFTVRHDEKSVPPMVVQEELKRRIEKLERAESREIGGKERAAIRDEVIFDLLPKAMPKTTLITAYYIRESGEAPLLIVDNASPKHADALVSTLIKTLGSVRTRTIHVDNLTGGLTSRLRNALEDHEHSGQAAFGGGFGIGSYLKLRKQGENATWNVDHLENRKESIEKCLDQGFEVDTLELHQPDSEGHLGTSFRLTSTFTLKSIKDHTAPEDLEFEDIADAWRHEATVNALTISRIARGLTRLFGYEEELEDEGDDEGGLI